MIAVFLVFYFVVFGPVVGLFVGCCVLAPFFYWWLVKVGSPHPEDVYLLATIASPVMGFLANWFLCLIIPERASLVVGAAIFSAGAAYPVFYLVGKRFPLAVAWGVTIVVGLAILVCSLRYIWAVTIG